MAKFSFEFKKQIVQDYLDGKGGYDYLGSLYSVPKEYVRKWVRNYNVNGDQGLMRSKSKKNYSFEYKFRVVEQYLSGEVSYQELALQEGINNPSQICKWVNDFKKSGIDGLRKKKKRLKKSLHTSEPDNDAASAETSTEYVRQLEEELYKLKIENAYLKELRRLRLEEETLLKKQRELSTASGESSN